MREKERKNNLVTVRLTDEETDALEYLSNRMGKNKSDVISRACMYFVNTVGDSVCGSLDSGREGNREGSGTDEKKSRRTIRVHARMSNSDIEQIKNCGMKTGDSVSQVVRQAIRSLASVNGRSY